jgi:hypothetical protein
MALKSRSRWCAFGASPRRRSRREKSWGYFRKIFVSHEREDVETVGGVHLRISGCAGRAWAVYSRRNFSAAK